MGSKLMRRISVWFKLCFSLHCKMEHSSNLHSVKSTFTAASCSVITAARCWFVLISCKDKQKLENTGPLITSTRNMPSVGYHIKQAVEWRRLFSHINFQLYAVLALYHSYKAPTDIWGWSPYCSHRHATQVSKEEIKEQRSTISFNLPPAQLKCQTHFSVPGWHDNPWQRCIWCDVGEDLQVCITKSKSLLLFDLLDNKEKNCFWG